jgi:hypothetical protein
MQTQTDAERKRANRERTALCRARKKERAAAEAIAYEERRFEEFNQWRVRERLVSPGEIEAFVNAESVEDAVQVTREYLVAMGLPDVQAGQTLQDIERIVVAGFCAPGGGLLNRNTLRIDASTASTTDCCYTFDFDKSWVALPGSDQPIDITTLPAIEVPAAVDTAGTTTEDTEVPIDAAIARAQLREERASSID